MSESAVLALELIGLAKVPDSGMPNGAFCVETASDPAYYRVTMKANDIQEQFWCSKTGTSMAAIQSQLVDRLGLEWLNRE